MNIFYLDANPHIAATKLYNVHVRKMLVESCQLLAHGYTEEQLATAPRTQKDTVRKLAYTHHPCTCWVQESYDNWHWLLRYTASVLNEYRWRFGKNHFCTEFVNWCSMHPSTILPDLGPTPVRQAMPEMFRNDDPVVAYRNYYSQAKAHLAGKR